MMNYELIRNFVTVANTRNITRASEILFVSQSTVSHRLQLLEDTLGHPLVYRGRGKRSAALTEQGRAFLPIAEKWLSLWQETEVFRTNTPLQHLRIGCVSSLATCLLSDFLIEFTVSHPNIRLSIQILSSEEIYQLMGKSILDVGIVLNHIPQQGLQSRPLLSEKMYCICTREISPTDIRLDPERLEPAKEIFLNWGMEFSLWHDYRISSAASPLLAVNEIDLIEKAIEKYEAWSIVPETVADHFLHNPRCIKRTLKNPPPNRVSYVLTSAVTAPATAREVEVFLEELDLYINSYTKHKD